MRVKGTLDVKASVKLGSLHMQASGSHASKRRLEHSQASCTDRTMSSYVLLGNITGFH